MCIHLPRPILQPNNHSDLCVITSSLFDIGLGFIVIKGTDSESLKIFGLGTLKALEKYLHFTTQTLQWAHFAKF